MKCWAHMNHYHIIKDQRYSWKEHKYYFYKPLKAVYSDLLISSSFVTSWSTRWQHSLDTVEARTVITRTQVQTWSSCKWLTSLMKGSDAANCWGVGLRRKSRKNAVNVFQVVRCLSVDLSVRVRGQGSITSNLLDRWPWVFNERCIVGQGGTHSTLLRIRIFHWKIGHFLMFSQISQGTIPGFRWNYCLYLFETKNK